MEKDQNDQFPPNSIIKLVRLLTTFQHPDWPFPSHRTCTVCNTRQKQIKETHELTRNSWRKTKMSDFHPTASLNWGRLLTMSKHPNQIQTEDRFRHTAPTHYTTHDKSRWEKHRNWQEEIDQNDQFPPNNIIINWVRLLTMSNNPNQIQIDRFRRTVPTHYTSHYK